MRKKEKKKQKKGDLVSVLSDMSISGSNKLLKSRENLSQFLFCFVFYKN